MSELQKEICKYMIAKKNGHLYNMAYLTEEMADVKIMLEQMELFLGVEENIKYWMEFKINRLDEGLKG